MAELAVRLGIKQAEFQHAILEAFHCIGKHERKKCAALILSMTTYDVMFDDDNKDGSDEKDKDKQTKDKVFYPTLSTLTKIYFFLSSFY